MEVSSYLFRWAHAKPSTKASAYVNGPMQYHQQQQLHMPMGPQNHRQQQLHIPMGPNKAIGSTCWKTNGPMQSHQQQQLHMPMGPCETIGQQKLLILMGPYGAIDSNSCICQWAHVKPLATTATYFDGPMQYRRQQQLHIPMGPNNDIGSNCCIC